MTPAPSVIGAQRWIGEPAWRANTYSSMYPIGLNRKSWQCILPLFHIFRDWKGVLSIWSSRDSRMTIFFILSLDSSEQINISLDMSSRLSLYPYQNHRARRLAPVRACVPFVERFWIHISSPGHRNSGTPWEMLKLHINLEERFWMDYNLWNVPLFKGTSISVTMRTRKACYVCSTWYSTKWQAER